MSGTPKDTIDHGKNVLSEERLKTLQFTETILSVVKIETQALSCYASFSSFTHALFTLAFDIMYNYYGLAVA